jgi:hypothetical protein
LKSNQPDFDAVPAIEGSASETHTSVIPPATGIAAGDPLP